MLSGTYSMTVAFNQPVYLSRGIHKVDVYWYTGSSTLTAYNIYRSLTAEER
jgi:hypothetical protein